MAKQQIMCVMTGTNKLTEPRLKFYGYRKFAKVTKGPFVANFDLLF